MDINSIKASPTANSYASVDEADDFLETVYGSEDWFELDDTKKEQLLMTATRQIDALRIIYPSATTTQALKFPATTDPDGFDQARQATIIQALFLLKFADELQEAEGNRIQGITDQRVLSLSRSSSGFNPMATIKPSVLQVLAPYIDMTLRAVR